MLNKVRITHEADADGYWIHVFNSDLNKEAQWRLDQLVGQKGYLLYRVDQKPTKRQHSVVEGDPEVWISAHAEDLAQSVM